MTTRPTSLPERLSEAAFSTYCWSSAFGRMIGASLVSIAAYPFRSPAEQSLWSARAFRPVLDTAKTRLQIDYAPGFDRERPSVFCFNHVNVLDAHTACAVIPQPFVGLMLAWHFHIPGYGWMMRATHGIPVHPASAGRTEELIRHAKDRAAHGMSILAFPEGHRTRDGKVGPYKRGLFFMARDAGMPIVPVAVRGMYEVNHKGSFLIRPGDVTIYVGAQIETEGLDDDGVVALAAAVQARVADYVEGRDPSGAGFASLAALGAPARGAEV